MKKPLQLYPAIDLLDGRCVRLLHGRFDRVDVYGDDPEAMAAGFAAAGATALHVVDLAGSRDGCAREAALVRKLAATPGLRVQVGGGIRSLAAAAAYLDAGASHVVVGSLAATDPELFACMARELGAERLTLALDVRQAVASEDDWVLAVQGWTAAAGSPWAVLDRALTLGVRRVLCTDVGRDGGLAGPNVGLYRTLLDRYPDVELLASGGIAALGDLAALRETGAAGAVVGKALYAGRFTLADALEAASC